MTMLGHHRSEKDYEHKLHGLRSWFGHHSKKDEQEPSSDYVNNVIRFAEKGDPVAQHDLGCMYLKGRGVDQCNKEALKWYKRSAEQGNASAQGHLGIMYEYGLGDHQNVTEALKWYKRSAEQGVAPAQFHVGDMHEYGKGVEADIGEAVKWYKLAAAKGDDAAHNALLRLAKDDGYMR